MPTLSAQKVYENTAAKIYTPTQQPYTPTQVVNSLVRAHSHVVRHGNAVEAAVYGKAVKIARAALDKARKEGFVPCGADCMEATVVECVCSCGGKNHGIKAQHESFNTEVVEEVVVTAKKGAKASAAAKELAALSA